MYSVFVDEREQQKTKTKKKENTMNNWMMEEMEAQKALRNLETIFNNPSSPVVHEVKEEKIVLPEGVYEVNGYSLKIEGNKVFDSYNNFLFFAPSSEEELIELFEGFLEEGE